MPNTLPKISKRIESMLSRHGKDIIVGFVFLVGIGFSLRCCSSSQSLATLIFAELVISCDIVLYFTLDRLYNKGALSADKVFVIILSFLAILFCIVFTPGSVPDEPSHFIAAYRYSDILLFQPASSDGFTMRVEDLNFTLDVLYKIRLEYSDYANIIDSGMLAKDATLVFVDIPDLIRHVCNLPQLKIPAALGITFGRCLGLGSYAVFYIGRLFNMAFFIVLVYFASKMMPFGKNILRVVALLPMTLHLCASYSYDAEVMGFAFLLIALCLRAIYEEGPIGRKMRAGIFVLAFLLAPCKVVYSVIALSILLIPTARFSSKQDAILFKAGVLGIVFLSICLFKATEIISISGVGTESSFIQRADGEGYYYSLDIIWKEPLQFLALLARTSVEKASFYFSSMIGEELAWFQADLRTSLFLTFTFFGMLLISTLPTPNDERTANPSHRLLFLVLAALSWLGIMLSMLFGWTFNTSPVIEGVQGRYLLPLLPLLLLSIRNTTFVCKRNISWALIFSMMVLNSLYMIRTFAIALSL